MSSKPTGGSENASPGEALTYATAWFIYHAQQRTQAFNFFLVVEAAIIASYGTQYGSASGVVLRVLATVGVLVSLPFWLLEIRNTELVNAGREALDALESRYLSVLPEEKRPRVRDRRRLDFVSAAQDGWRWPPSSHIARALRTRTDQLWSDGKGRSRPAFALRVIRHGFVFRTLFLLSSLVWFVLLVHSCFWYRQVQSAPVP